MCRHCENCGRFVIIPCDGITDRLAAAHISQAGVIPGKGRVPHMIESTSSATRRGGRGERRAIRTCPNHDMLPHLAGRLPLTAPMDDEQIARIEG